MVKRNSRYRIPPSLQALSGSTPGAIQASNSATSVSRQSNSVDSAILGQSEWKIFLKDGPDMPSMRPAMRLVAWTPSPNSTRVMPLENRHRERGH